MTEPVDLLILHALIVTMDAQGTILEDGALAVRGDSITAVGPSAQLAGLPAGETIDAAGALVMPGLINAHTHSADSLFRGLVEDLPLEPWLQKLWKAEAAFVRRDTVFWGAALAYLEMLRGGITTAVDMFWFPEAMAEAGKACGLRLVTGPVYFDSAGPGGLTSNDTDALARAFLEQYRADPLIIPALQPHATYTVSPDFLARVGALAREYGVFFHTHASETAYEVQSVRERYGLTPVKHLDRLGLLDRRTILAHCVHLEEDEFDLLREREVTAVHCPLSNTKVASGIAPVAQMLSRGVKVALGTDGPVSGNDLNHWLTMRLAAVLQKVTCRDTAVLGARQVVELATCGAAAALGLQERIGSLEPGKRADLLLVDRRTVHAVPSYDPYALIVYALGREDVRTVLVNGRVVVRDRQIQTIDEQETLARVEEIARQVSAFMTAG